MLPVDLDTLRLFLHVLAATIWVGGQVVLAGLVPVLRRAGAEVPRAAARAYNRVAWPAFGVLVATGFWNIAAQHQDRESNRPGYQSTLTVKLILVVISGASAYAHTRAGSRAGLAVWGALAGLSALGALFYGIVLAG